MFRFAVDSDISDSCASTLCSAPVPRPTTPAEEDRMKEGDPRYVDEYQVLGRPKSWAWAVVGIDGSDGR
jgi:hypothetical protein